MPRGVPSSPLLTRGLLGAARDRPGVRAGQRRCTKGEFARAAFGGKGRKAPRGFLRSYTGEFRMAAPGRGR
eukprot:15443294-Alexandrium_andersonii.AAC.1